MRQDDLVELSGDVLTPLARDLATLDLPTAYTRLVVQGDGSPAARERLAAVKPASLVPGIVASPDDARALLAGLWLWHDWLDESHTISQSISTPSGSLWHAIMHRREGDFSNSKYWNARCRNHPIFHAMAPRAAALLHPLPADKSLLRPIRDGWDPDGFVDLVEQVYRTPDDPRHAVVVRLQQMEWRLLFDHCARAATGS